MCEFDVCLNACSVAGYIEEYQKKNLAKANTLYKKACDRGGLKGCTGLGDLERIKGNLVKASSFYKKSCDGKEIKGCFGLGIIEGSKGNSKKAKMLLNQACDGGYNVACETLVKLNNSSLK